MFSDSVRQSVVLGVLQGLTEFLPISSSAHLIVLPWLLGWRPMGLEFDVALHVGTLVSVLIFFRNDLLRLVRASWTRMSEIAHGEPTTSESKDVQLSMAIAVGTVPAVVIGGLFGEAIEGGLRHPGVTVFTLSFFGILLLAADRMLRQRRRLDAIGWKEGLVVGTAQALALIPGVSRSGITITAGLALGLRRDESARFSFLLGTPVIVLAALKGAFDLWTAPRLETASATAFMAGIIVSALSGFLCIKYFLHFLQNRTYLPFVVYRWLLAFFILLLLLR